MYFDDTAVSAKYTAEVKKKRKGLMSPSPNRKRPLNLTRLILIRRHQEEEDKDTMVIRVAPA